MKLFIGVFVLLAYVGIGVFGLFEFNHTPESSMANCPYSENSFSVCGNSLDHIINWQQFSNIIFPSLFTLLFLILGMVLYFFSKQKSLNQKEYFYKWKYYLNDKKYQIHSNKIIRWLSLFENSPSFLYKT